MDLRKRVIDALAVGLVAALVVLACYQGYVLNDRLRAEPVPTPRAVTVEDFVTGESAEGYWDRMKRMEREEREAAWEAKAVWDEARRKVEEPVVEEPVVEEPVVEEPVVEETPFVDLVQDSLKGVVHIGCPQWQGSGFVVGPNLICTARHVNDGVEDFLITTNDKHQVRATRAISDKLHDVSFIYVDDLTCVAKECTVDSFDGVKILLGEHKVVLHPLELGPIKDCVLGQGVYVIGSPYGKINFNSLTTGIISGVDVDWSPLGGDYGWEVAFTVDSAGHPGNSGCPVFTTDGVVRGILVGGFSPVLISVMPCDLFISDLASIRLMFTQDKYRREVTKKQVEEFYSVETESEYY